MGQKISPLALRLGYIQGWEANWFATKKDFAAKLVEDEHMRKYVKARIAKAGVSRVVIERTIKRITLTVHTARPGMVIGKGGAEVDQVREELKKLTKQEVQVNVVEIKRPELDAKLVADSIGQQLKARGSYKRAMKQAIASTMRVGAQGIKVKVAGRLGGAEIARSEVYKEGRIPLHTLRAEIDYAAVGIPTIYGIIGVKVWICKGEVYKRRDLSPNTRETTKKEPLRSAKKYFSRKSNRRV